MYLFEKNIHLFEQQRFSDTLAHDLNLSTISDKIYQMICFSQKKISKFDHKIYTFYGLHSIYIKYFVEHINSPSD